MKRTHSQSNLGETHTGFGISENETRGQNPESTEENPAPPPPVMQQLASNAGGHQPAISRTTNAPEEQQPATTEPTLRNSFGDSSKKEEMMGSATSSISVWANSSASASSSSSVMVAGSEIQARSQSFKALIFAIENGDIASIVKLVHEGAPLINPSLLQPREAEDMALATAYKNNRPDILAFLMTHPKIEDEKKDCYYLYDASFYTSSYESEKCFNLLVRAGFTTGNEDEFPVKTSSIRLLVDQGEYRLDDFQRLFRAGANPNSIDPTSMLSDYEEVKQDSSWSAYVNADPGELGKILQCFESSGLILGKPHAMKKAIESQDFTRLENQVRHDLRSAEQCVDPQFMQSADSLDRLDMPAVAADLLRFPELTRPRSAWQPTPTTLGIDPLLFSAHAANGSDWRHILLEAGFARPIIDFLETKLGQKLELLAFIAPPQAPTSSSSDAIFPVHTATPVQIWHCLKGCVDQLLEPSVGERIASAYTSKGLSPLTKARLEFQFVFQITRMLDDVSTKANLALTSFEHSVQALVGTCWRLCPSYAGGATPLRLENELREAGMLNALASRVVKSWTEVMDSLNAGNFTPPVLIDGVGLLDTPQGERIANLFGERLLANSSLEPSGLPLNPAFDPLLYRDTFVSQVTLIKRFAKGAIEFTRTA